jgi:hypothetical protein
MIIKYGKHIMSHHRRGKEKHKRSVSRVRRVDSEDVFYDAIDRHEDPEAGVSGLLPESAIAWRPLGRPSREMEREASATRTPVHGASSRGVRLSLGLPPRLPLRLLTVAMMAFQKVYAHLHLCLTTNQNPPKGVAISQFNSQSTLELCLLATNGAQADHERLCAPFIQAVNNDQQIAQLNNCIRQNLPSDCPLMYLTGIVSPELDPQPRQVFQSTQFPDLVMSCSYFGSWASTNCSLLILDMITEMVNAPQRYGCASASSSASAGTGSLSSEGSSSSGYSEAISTTDLVYEAQDVLMVLAFLVLLISIIRSLCQGITLGPFIALFEQTFFPLAQTRETLDRLTDTAHVFQRLLGIRAPQPQQEPLLPQ